MKSFLDHTQIKLDRKRPEQLHHQLASELSRLIGSQTGSSGAILPSGRELSARLGIHRKTVRKAYDELMKRHLIEPESSYRYKISAQKKRAGLVPYPSIGIILPCSFSMLIKQEQSAAALPYITGITDSAMENRLSTIMLELPDFDASPEEIQTYTDSLTQRLLGLVHIGGRNHWPDHPLEALLNHKELPQVFIAGITKMPNVGAVVCDADFAAEILVKLFRRMNHREVGIMLQFNGFDDIGTTRFLSYASRIRAQLIRKTFERAGLNCDNRFHCTGCSSYAVTLKKMKEKVRSRNLPTVYFCHNDMVARWCIRALMELGFDVPNDISVVGFDGLPGSGTEITTFNMPFYAMGRSSVAQLLDYSKNGIHESNRISYLKPVLSMGKTLSYAKR
ncbi:MAG: GntR family transcriptional regulator [Lentisphaeria bacterium]|nr:GntR family transcriptional regulator [Lentisphaeria bacterium]